MQTPYSASETGETRSPRVCLDPVSASPVDPPSIGEISLIVLLHSAALALENGRMAADRSTELDAST